MKIYTLPLLLYPQVIILMYIKFDYLTIMKFIVYYFGLLCY